MDSVEKTPASYSNAVAALASRTQSFPSLCRVRPSVAVMMKQFDGLGQASLELEDAASEGLRLSW